jgi:hypothetical protein
VELVIGFIGGLAAIALKGSVDFWFERRRERRAVRGAARLLAHEFDFFALWLDMVIDGGVWEEPEDWTFDREVWKDTKTLLASGLPDRFWGVVTTGYRGVGQIDTLRAQAREEARTTVDERNDLQLVRMYRDDAEAAADALDRTAGRSARGAGTDQRTRERRST